MTGQIVQVNVEPGERVKAGDVLAILEAMKMQNEVTAPSAGVVRSVAVQPGMRVNPGDVIVVLEVAEGA
jgi:glutaconyl-CoA decarboxylase